MASSMLSLASASASASPSLSLHDNLKGRVKLGSVNFISCLPDKTSSSAKAK
ncbi:hypothetical protein CRG98_036489, partial [Punica granatum]